jgi:hypothetical protein
MNPFSAPSATNCAARLLRMAVPACLLLSACGPSDESAAGPPPRYRAPLPEPRRTAKPSKETAQWLAAWRDLRTRLAPLEEALAEAQKVHADYQFDAFLELDPHSVGKDQLCSLYHFLERGWFTVEREAVIHLLERRLERATAPPVITAPARPRLKDGFAAAMQRDELRMLDIESAIEYYQKPGDADFQIPTSLTEDELLELRGAVADMLEETLGTVAEMDEKIARLKSEVFGTPYEAPPARPVPAATPEPETIPDEPATVEEMPLAAETADEPAAEPEPDAAADAEPVREESLFPGSIDMPDNEEEALRRE